jgi:hypothetical protein
MQLNYRSSGSSSATMVLCDIIKMNTITLTLTDLSWWARVRQCSKQLVVDGGERSWALATGSPGRPLGTQPGFDPPRPCHTTWNTYEEQRRQCWGSVIFWCGSRPLTIVSDSFFSDVKDAIKNLFFKIFFSYNLPAATLSSVLKI